MRRLLGVLWFDWFNLGPKFVAFDKPGFFVLAWGLLSIGGAIGYLIGVHHAL